MYWMCVGWLCRCFLNWKANENFWTSDVYLQIVLQHVSLWWLLANLFFSRLLANGTTGTLEQFMTAAAGDPQKFYTYVFPVFCVYFTNLLSLLKMAAALSAEEEQVNIDLFCIFTDVIYVLYYYWQWVVLVLLLQLCIFGLIVHSTFPFDVGVAYPRPNYRLVAHTIIFIISS